MRELPATDDDLTGEPFETPPGEHDGELPDERDAEGADGGSGKSAQEENAETGDSHQPSQ